MSATFLWPAFFALGWMQYRFLDLEFHVPGLGFSLGYIGVFIIIYILAYVIFKQVKRRLPFYRRPAGRARGGPGPAPGPGPALIRPLNIYEHLNVYTKM